MQIVVDDLLTHYELEGKGSVLLVLHGWGDNLDGLKNLRAQLSKKYQVLALDLPGFGATQAPKEVWNLDNYGDFVAAFLAKLKLKPAVVVGHSNGGALAIRAIATDKLQPQKLVLLAASGIRSRQGAKRLLLKVVAKVGNIATYGLPERYRRALRKSLYGAAGSDMLVVPQLQETFKVTVRQDVQEDARQLTVPTLLVYARGDKAVPLADGETYHALIADSKLVTIEDAGHFVHIDQPEQTLRAIEEFLA